MFATHDGLSHDYEVSCAELDFIVDIAHATDGVLGARMMGGGFGGCVISLVRDTIHDSYVNEVQEKFTQKFGKTPRSIDVVIGDGAHEIK